MSFTRHLMTSTLTAKFEGIFRVIKLTRLNFRVVEMQSVESLLNSLYDEASTFEKIRISKALKFVAGTRETKPVPFQIQHPPLLASTLKAQQIETKINFEWSIPLPNVSLYL